MACRGCSLSRNGRWAARWKTSLPSRMRSRGSFHSCYAVPAGRLMCVLPYNHTPYMLIHMKTTLNIDDRVMARLRREAARQDKTMSELVETALRRLLAPRSAVEPPPPLPVFSAGRIRVDVANRDVLYSSMDER